MPIEVGQQRQKPTLMYAIIAPGFVPLGTVGRLQDNYISTGIYRCIILDFDVKFCENFKVSRISADKRFFKYFHFVPLPLFP